MANVQIKQIETITNDSIDKTKKLYSIVSSANDTLLRVPLGNKEQDQYNYSNSFDPEYEMLASKLISDMDYANMPDLTKRDSDKIFLTRTLKNNPQFMKGSFYGTTSYMTGKPNYSNCLGNTITNEQKLAIRNGTFDGMNLGDYWLLSDSNDNQYICTIVGFNNDTCISPKDITDIDPLAVYDGDPEAEEPDIEIKYSRNARFTNVPENGLMHANYRNTYKNYNHLYLLMMPYSSSSIPASHPLSTVTPISDRDSDANDSTLTVTKTYLETHLFERLDGDVYTAALQSMFGDFLMPQCVGTIGQLNHRINTVADDEHDSYIDLRWGYAFTPSLLNLGPIEGPVWDSFEYLEEWFRTVLASESFYEVDEHYGWTAWFEKRYNHAQFLRIGNPYLPGLSPTMRGTYGYNNYITGNVYKQSAVYRDCIMFTSYYHAANISWFTYLIKNATAGANPSHIRMQTLSTFSQASINSVHSRVLNTAGTLPYNIVKIGAEPIPAN